MASGAAPTIAIGAVCASATSSTVDQPASSAYVLHLADHIGQCLFRPEYIGSGTSESEPHRESSLHQHSRPSPHQKTLVAPPRNCAKLLSTRFTRFNRRPVHLTRHPLRYHVKKARHNVCPMCVVLLSLSLDVRRISHMQTTTRRPKRLRTSARSLDKFAWVAHATPCHDQKDSKTSQKFVTQLLAAVATALCA